MKPISLNPMVPLEAMAVPLSRDWVARLNARRRCFSEFFSVSQRYSEILGESRHTVSEF